MLKKKVHCTRLILVTAGKTEAAKILMQYLSVVSKSGDGGRAALLKKKILVSNPILEAFGNAVTERYVQ